MTDLANAALLLVIVVEMALVVVVAPRLAARRVKLDATSIFDEHMRPGIRDEIRIGVAALGKLPSAADVAALLPQLPVVPSAKDVAGAVRDALVEAQAKASEGKPDPAELLRGILRDELQAFGNQLANEPPGPEEAAQVLGRRGADSRITFAAQEEQFQHAIMQQAGGTNGPLALAALEHAKSAFPATYKAMVRQGQTAVPGFLNKAGIQVAGGMAAAGSGLL